MIVIPNMDRPESCFQCDNSACDHWGEYGYDNSADCPIIEIDENDPMLLEFLNEFDKWRAYKELMDSIRMAQKKGEADDGNLNSYNITETEYTIAKDSETVVFKNGKNQF